METILMETILMFIVGALLGITVAVSSVLFYEKKWSKAISLIPWIYLFGISWLALLAYGG